MAIIPALRHNDNIFKCGAYHASTSGGFVQSAPFYPPDVARSLVHRDGAHDYRH